MFFYRSSPIIIFAFLFLSSIFLPVYGSEHNGSYRGPYKDCTFEPDQIDSARPERVIAKVETEEPYDVWAEVLVENVSDDQDRGDKKFEYDGDETEKLIREIDLGAFDAPGIYKVTISQKNEDSGPRCEIDNAFVVFDSSSAVKFEDPKSPIDLTNTLPVIRVTGLEPKKFYIIEAKNFEHNDIIHDLDRGVIKNIWPSNGDGVLIIKNICNNAEANRTDDDPCEDTFESKEYGLIIYKAKKEGGNYVKDGPGLANHLFTVKSAGLPGKNPCASPDPSDPNKFIVEDCPTALGNIPTNITEFAGRVLAIALGLAGGIALVIMVFGSIKILTSSGDPQKVAAGRDMIVAAIAGLLFLIFSVLILRFIGQTFNLPFG